MVDTKAMDDVPRTNGDPESDHPEYLGADACAW
jgi:hypothetical protein